MRRKGGSLTIWSITVIVFCSTFMMGCDADVLPFFGPNFGLNVIIPAGFGGNPGAFNPFGLTQAFVNSLIGASSSSSSSSSTDSSAATSPNPNAGALVTLVNNDNGQ